MKKRMLMAVVLIAAATFFSCKDYGGDKVLYGDWENRNTAGTEYTNKILRIEGKTEEMKKDKENDYDGIYKMAYMIDKTVVIDSVIEGKWRFLSAYNKDKKGYINQIQMQPDDANLKVQTFEFYFDGSMLMFIDRASTVPTTDSYYKVEGGIAGF